MPRLGSKPASAVWVGWGSEAGRIDLVPRLTNVTLVPAFTVIVAGLKPPLFMSTVAVAVALTGATGGVIPAAVAGLTQIHFPFLHSGFCGEGQPGATSPEQAASRWAAGSPVASGVTAAGRSGCSGVAGPELPQAAPTSARLMSALKSAVRLNIGDGING